MLMNIYDELTKSAKFKAKYLVSPIKNE